MLCQRYLPIFNFGAGSGILLLGMGYASTYLMCPFYYHTQTRVPPTGLTYTGTPSNMIVYAGNATTGVSAIAFQGGDINVGVVQVSASVASAACGILRAEASADAKILFTGCEL